jgi:hypothetical protein
MCGASLIALAAANTTAQARDAKSAAAPLIANFTILWAHYYGYI